LEQLHRELGLGLIYVTNLMEEAALAERVIVLDQGRLVKEGTPREIFADSNWLEERNLAMPQLCQLAAQLADAGYAHLRGCLNQEELLQGLNSLHPVIDGECPEPLPDKFATKGEKQLWMDQVSYIYQQSSINACQALNDVDLCIKKGELTAIIGHGGSGKSTLATLAAGLYLPTSGHVFLNGEEAAKESVFRQAGLVFQYPEQQLFGETVFEEVAFGPKNFGVAESWLPIKVREALTDVGLLPELFWHRSPFTLSGGQKRRVCIAGILATDPQVMIFDEPSAGLDEGGRRWIMNLTTRLNQAGKTILWISHNMSEVAELADRLIVLAQGRIIADGTPCQVFAQADALKRAGLETPPIYQLCHNLRRLGWPLPENIITVTEAKDALLRILGGKGNV
ncbi:MAG: ATP-binding cassette domain-containing protein, partial [Clostridiales bacterium]